MIGSRLFLVLACLGFANAAPLYDLPLVEAIPKYELHIDETSGVKFGNLKVYVHANETVELRCIVDPRDFDLPSLTFTGPNHKKLEAEASMGGQMITLKIDHFRKTKDRGGYECSAKTLASGIFQSRLFLVEFMEHIITETCKTQCHNGGTCMIDTLGDEKCHCVQGWSGKDCLHPDVADHIVQGLSSKWFAVLVAIAACFIFAMSAAIVLCHRLCIHDSKHKKTINMQHSIIQRHQSVISENKTVIFRQKSVIDEQNVTIGNCRSFMRQKNVTIPHDLDKRLSKQDNIDVVTPVKGPPLLNGNSKPCFNGFPNKDTEERVPLKRPAA